MAVYHRHPGSFPLNFILIGAGGTGSRIIPMLSQLIQSLDYLKNLRPVLFVIDDDVVEKKNLARQLFAPNDVGRNKAEVLVERYSHFYPNLEMHAVPARVVDRHSLPTYTIGTLVESGMQPQAAIKLMSRRTCVITAVDSMSSRRKCLASALYLPAPLGLTFIDPGNEDTFGQVSIFSALAQIKIIHDVILNRVNALPDLCPVRLEAAYIPMPLVHYFTTPDGERTGGCADLDQTLALNALAATRVFDYIQAMMFNVPISTYITRFGLGGEASCQKLDVSFLKRCARGEAPGFTDYERIAEWFDIPILEFFDLVLSSTNAGDTLRSKLKPGFTMEQEHVDILNALYLLPCFDLDGAEERLKEYETQRLERAAEAVRQAQQQTPQAAAS